ncbi:putative ester cyclase [Methylovorus glucosotrophus]|uniref:ester cyclase n=1 Tax=Methylovorus glucosotrophus TaxID=266009 RepID=UPI0013316E92|nr:ester cyclase [Methylovorus glucosotrophus]KAF0843235.1 putative ester cyclase [Methylovorus glucosotrophus]
MDKYQLAAIYREYISCLNKQNWQELGRYVHSDVQRNGEKLGIEGYEAMLRKSYEDIPDLEYRIGILVAEPPIVATRLLFDCTPHGEPFGIPVNGKRISFSENVFYVFREEKIEKVWSVIDVGAIAAQL